jgi:hypothetical protein
LVDVPLVYDDEDNMTKIIRTAAARVAEGVVHGFAQMGSAGQADVQKPAKKTATEALRGDWTRLGSDMSRAIEKVKASGSSQ